MSVWKGEKGEGVHLGSCCDKPGKNREGGKHITWGEKEGRYRLGEQSGRRNAEDLATGCGRPGRGRNGMVARTPAGGGAGHLAMLFIQTGN